MVNPLHVILPLYIYPTATNTWSNIFTSISDNPSVEFDIIINPESGPGVGAIPYASDPAYVANIAQLNTYPNTNLIGYVHTSYSAEPLAAIEKNITVYAGWKSYAGANITLNGIFFDETVSQYTASDYAYLKSASDFARSSGLNSIVFNPGAVSVADYYALADQIVAFENTETAYVDQIPGWIGAAQMSKSSFMMYGFAGTEADQTTMVDKLAATGIKSLFISSLSVYDQTSPLWAQFVAAVAAYS